MLVNFISKSIYNQLKFLLLVGIFILIPKSYCSNIEFGEVNIAQNRINLSDEDFNIVIKSSKTIKVQASLAKSSFEWIRVNNILPMPRARLDISINLPIGFSDGKDTNYHLRYEEKNLGFSTVKTPQKVRHSTSFYYSLFENKEVFIYEDDKKVATLQIFAKKSKNKHYIDYTCSRYNIKIEGMENSYLSLGCKKLRVGNIGSERSIIEVHWAISNFRTMDLNPSPYIINMHGKVDSRLKLISLENKSIKSIAIRATTPKRSKRLNVAYGLGPYGFETEFKNKKKQNSIGIDQPIAPALMLYFNFNVDSENSIRGFNAVVFQESVFNNLGVYYANDVATLLDNRLKITTLLGMQHLYFKFNDDSTSLSEPIFPQGLEFTYKHAFDIENYIISGGAFITPSESYDYQNLWIRWGQDIFWELNYIYWADQGFSAKMWGLSAGFFFDSYI